MEEPGKTTENGTNGTQETPVEAVVAPIPPEEPPKEKTEQERTAIAKEAFIKEFEKNMGIVKSSAMAIGISRSTFHRWYDDDPEFRKEINRIKIEQLGEVEDRLLKAILREESWAISLYLNRVHPKYRPKQENYNMPVTKTLEDLLDEDQEKLNQTDGGIKGEDKPGADREAVQDPGQAPEGGAVQTEPGAGVLLGEENAPQHPAQGEAKGTE